MIEIRYLKSDSGLDNCFEIWFWPLDEYIPDVDGVLELFLVYKHQQSSSLSHGHGPLIHAQLLPSLALFVSGPYFASYSSLSG